MSLMKSLGQNVIKEELNTIIEEVNIEGDEHKEIGFAAFVVIISRLVNHTSDEEQNEAFKNISVNKNGESFVDPVKLAKELEDVGLKINADELVELIQEADYDGDGRIDLEGDLI
jgi:calmodulin